MVPDIGQLNKSEYQSAHTKKNTRWGVHYYSETMLTVVCSGDLDHCIMHNLLDVSFPCPVDTKQTNSIIGSNQCAICKMFCKLNCFILGKHLLFITCGIVFIEI